MSARFLFVAVTSGATGELALGRGIAAGLADRGHAITFLAPAAAADFIDGTRFRHVPIDEMLPRLSDGLARVLRAHPSDAVVLVDLTSVFLGLETIWAQDASFLCDLPVPVAALDIWDIAETDLRWDFGTDAVAIPPRALEVRRLVPVPFVRPRHDGRCYNALPSPRQDPEERARLRHDLGLEAGDRLVLVLTSRWQVPDAQLWKHHRRMAEHLPVLALQAMAALGPRVHVAHVGPQAFPGAEALGPRYHFLRQLPPDRFAAVTGASDMLLSFATSSAAAFNCLVLGVPVLLAINSVSGRTVEEVTAAMGGPAAAPVRAWLERVVPLYPYRLWPLGLYGMLTPAMKDNPFAGAVRTVELLDWEGLLEGARALLFDAEARETARRRQAAYVEQVRRLPAAADVLLAQL